MNLTFLERFQGKTNTITKTGIENALRLPHDHSLIYTNTQKSFGSVLARHFHHQGYNENESKLSVKQSNQQEHIGKQALRLPTIAERYLAHKNHDLDLSLRGQLRGQIDRQTNWIIENDVRSTYPAQIGKMSEGQLQKQKENRLTLKRTAKQLEKRSCQSTKYERLGGLGANIGGQQWEMRHLKQQKAMIYAQKLRKIKREKQLHSHQDQQRHKINLRSIL